MVKIDAAGYIVIASGLFFIVVMTVSILLSIYHGKRSEIAIKWAGNAGLSAQILGLALACSSTTMPTTPLLIYLTIGIYFFALGRSMRLLEKMRRKPVATEENKQ
ncbi:MULTISPECIES: hypothetical protein [Pseudomonas]|uniref:Uncharacterized protein n=1 Tax=Pseudomonas syringae pv. actinidiae TaxID=103796 RepID=A0A2P0QI04_PSESF|nr:MULTISPECIES: hypothetical protein [Pseudomonas]APQ06982.1 hypothetical protein PsaNZ47_30025 [Pseudomonas syringae pv. actinidiae]ARO44962.1 hypothetical protein [Pseudomonas syringae pv. actinidiae]ARO45067.1 hypothetical protein [Pseudomonas syringae pv. actinidiae]ARO45158.1 hypothetical protein [Pseudomonas syringae pv. actinidiae]ARO45200.1 hypothetical protein [Pseudomonas syringae pv. actinidiae]